MSEILDRLTDGTILYFIPAALVCIILHEFAHGFVAYKLGDPTARDAGRLTLNPLKHIDIVGLLMMIFAGFGWAKPVPVDMRYFKKPKRDMAIVGLAGPVTNIIIAFVCFIVVAAFETWVVYSRITNTLYLFFYYTAVLSTGLAVFNLIPLSPLDGSKVLFSVFPDRVYYTILHYERYSSLILFALLMLGNVSPELDFFSGFLGIVRDAVTGVLQSAAEAPFSLLG